MQIDTSALPNKWIKDYRGQRFHRLTVIAFERNRPGGGAIWRCQCDCGKQTTAAIYDLRSGHTTSCGCASADRLRAMRTTHGMSSTNEYSIWQGIRARCYNVNHPIYPYYGGRGIVMCERWQAFENFFADMGKRPGLEYSIERIDKDGPYSPDNCKWATDVEQMNNHGINHFITYHGETKTIAQWARVLDIPYNRLRARILNGVPVERAFAYKILPERSDKGQHRGPHKHPAAAPPIG